MGILGDLISGRGSRLFAGRLLYGTCHLRSVYSNYASIAMTFAPNLSTGVDELMK
jgi:hypothetical protein